MPVKYTFDRAAIAAALKAPDQRKVYADAGKVALAGGTVVDDKAAGKVYVTFPSRDAAKPFDALLPVSPDSVEDVP